MASEVHGEVQTQATLWHIRLRDGDAAVWEEFAGWLAEDPRHAPAYDAIEETDLAIDPLLPDLRFHEAANDAAPLFEQPARRTRRWVIGGGAIAAAIASAFFLAPQFVSDRYEVVTAPGETRAIALDATTRVTLNGATRMTFDHKDARFAALASGEALFEVQHDSARPFRLELGDSKVVDIGTVFNVVREPDEVRVAVAEGEIVYDRGANATPVRAGLALVARAGAAGVRVTRTAAEAVGLWHKGRLVYAGDPLSRVAADLSRSLGISISVAPEIAGRPYSGTIALDGNRAAQRARLQFALNVTLDSTPGGWVMRPVAGGRR